MKSIRFKQVHLRLDHLIVLLVNGPLIVLLQEFQFNFLPPQLFFHPLRLELYVETLCGLVVFAAKYFSPLLGFLTLVVSEEVVIALLLRGLWFPFRFPLGQMMHILQILQSFFFGVFQ